MGCDRHAHIMALGPSLRLSQTPGDLLPPGLLWIRCNVEICRGWVL